MKIEKIYYVWGNEEPGNVSTSEYDEKENLILTGEMPKKEAIAQGRVFTCPFS